MREFQVEHPDSKLLWLVWVLMREFEKAKAEKRKNRRGIIFFHLPPVYGMKYFNSFYSLDEVLENYLCVRDGIISEMFVDLYEPVTGEDPTSYAVGSMPFRRGKAISENDREALNRYDSYGYDINLDYARAKAFVTSYINKWQEEEFEHPTRNLLEFTEQRKRVLEEISRLLNKGYVKKNLHISFDFDAKDYSAEVDFIAVLLSLEQSEDLEITEIKPTQKDPLVKNKITWEAVVSLRDKFYSEFSGVDLSPLARVTKEEQRTILNSDEVVEYDPLTWKFYYMGKQIHKINQSGSPAEIFNTAFGVSSTSYKFPHNKETPAKRSQLCDNIRHFRLLLRKKLKEAPSILTTDFLLRLDGGLVVVSPRIVRKSHAK